MLAAWGIIVSHGTIRQGVRKFGRAFVSPIRRHLPSTDEKWHFDEVVIVVGEGWLRSAVVPTGVVLDVLVQSQRGQQAAKPLAAQAASARVETY